LCEDKFAAQSAITYCESQNNPYNRNSNVYCIRSVRDITVLFVPNDCVVAALWQNNWILPLR
jgi:hypothetical protein